MWAGWGRGAGAPNGHRCVEVWLNARSAPDCIAVTIAIRHCGIRLKPDNLTAHRAWVLAEYWDRNVRAAVSTCNTHAVLTTLPSIACSSVALVSGSVGRCRHRCSRAQRRRSSRACTSRACACVCIKPTAARLHDACQLPSSLQLLAIWKRFIAPRLSSVLYHIRTNKAIGGRDASTEAEASARASTSTGTPRGPFGGDSASDGGPDVPAAGDTATLVLHNAWCSGLFKAASAVLRVRQYRAVCG